jgi:hypothetical protein
MLRATPADARRILSRINIVEIEIGVLRGQCLDRKKINISTVLAGQRVGIKEVDDGIWLVGTRLSPMS